MSDYIQDNFLPEDHEQAREQLDCYMRCTKIAIQNKLTGNDQKSDDYFENAKRSYDALAELRVKHDKAWFIIKQNEADMKMAEMLVKAYD